eukprot:10086621-Alexandrium_andersonii.AAC.1
MNSDAVSVRQGLRAWAGRLRFRGWLPRPRARSCATALPPRPATRYARRARRRRGVGPRQPRAKDQPAFGLP